MDKQKLNDILTILMMPFCAMELWKEGQRFLADKEEAFFHLVYGKYEAAEQKRYKKKYDQATGNLQNYFIDCQAFHFKSVDEIMLYVELFYPDKEAAGFLYENGIRADKNTDTRQVFYMLEKYYIKKLCEAADALCVLRDGKIALRTEYRIQKGNVQDFLGHYSSLEKVEVWNTVTRLMPPDIFFAAYYSWHGLTDIKNLHGQKGRIVLADRFLENILKRGIAETHQHMGVGYEYTYLWNQAMHLPGTAAPNKGPLAHGKKITQYQLFCAALFRYMAADYLENYAGLEFDSYMAKVHGTGNIAAVLKDFYKGEREGSVAKGSTDIEELRNEAVRKMKQQKTTAAAQEDYLAATVYARHHAVDTAGENIFLLQMLANIQKKEKPDVFVHLCLQYLRIKNQFFNYYVQKNEMLGLDYFQAYYRKASGMLKVNADLGKKDKIRQIVKTQCRIDNLKKLEFRLSADVGKGAGMDVFQDAAVLKKEIKINMLKQLQTIFAAYAQCIQEVCGQQDAGNGIAHIGLVYHFIKKNDMDNISGNYCWLSPAESVQKSNFILQWQKKTMLDVEALVELREEIPFLAEYVVGIDAASLENSMEPWAFAPIYGHARRYEMTHGKVQSLGFTYHVGEDFRHVLSGLRHIDEVLEHFSYRESDRLGHAIVLGLDIPAWIYKNEAVVMPRFEHLQNLLWIWGYKVKGHQGLSCSLNVLEKQIMDIAQDIYGNVQGITPYILYEVYQEKFAGEFQAIFGRNEKYILRAGGTGDGEIYCKYLAESEMENFAWNKERLLCTNFCPVYEAKCREPILVAITKEQKDIMEELQEILIKKVETRGIYVETNPSSNVAIGEIEGLAEHYIVKLNSSGLSEAYGHAVLVTINSDDPAVFNTDVASELAYIYYVLTGKGYSREAVLYWIDKVRQYGLDSSFIKKTKPAKQIEAEIRTILKCIASDCK